MMNSTKRSTLLLAGTVLMTAAAQAQTATPSALLREADLAPTTAPGQTISDLRDVRTNQANGFGVTFRSQGPAGEVDGIWGNFSPGAGALLREEITTATYIQQYLDNPFGMSAAELCYGARVDVVAGATDLESVWLDDTILALVDDPRPGGIDYFGFFRSAGITSGGVPYFVAGLSDTVGGSALRRGLFIGTTPTALYESGDIIPNMPAPLSGSAVDYDFKFSANGTHNMLEMDCDTGSSSDDRAMSIDGVGLMLAGTLTRESLPVPVAIGGHSGENWDNFDHYAITESGDYMFYGDTDGTTTADEFIVRNGLMWHREGDIIGGHTVTGSIEEAVLNENNTLAYIWDIDVAGSSIEALFVEETLVLKEGDAVDWDGDGVIDPGATIEVFNSSLSLANDGTIYFTADVNVGSSTLEGYFEYQGGPVGIAYCPGDGIAPHSPCPCVNDNDGSIGGCDWGDPAFPGGGVLGATGSQSMAANNTILVATGISNDFGIFFGADNRVNGGNGNHLNDGLRCAGGALVRLISPTPGSGNTATLPSPVQVLDTGAAAGVTRRYQYWFRTPGGPCATTANLTNGLEIVWQL